MLYTGSLSDRTRPTKALAESLSFREISSSSWVLLQELLRLVDLGGEVRAAASIGVVEEHHGSVGLADFVLRDLFLATEKSGLALSVFRNPNGSTMVPARSKPRRRSQGGWSLLQRQDQARLFLVHLGLEAALVKGLPKRTNAAARPSPCDKTSPPL